MAAFFGHFWPFLAIFNLFLPGCLENHDVFCAKINSTLFRPFSTIFSHYFHRAVVGHAKLSQESMAPLFALLSRVKTTPPLHVLQSVMTECKCMHIVV